MAEEENIREVFSDVYAVLSKKWKEKHHDRLCEILANVESECSVEISFVKGSYQFRGTLPAIFSVQKSLRFGSRGNRSLSPEASDDDVQRQAQQHVELSVGKDVGPDSAEVYNRPTSDVASNEEKTGSGWNAPRGRRSAAGDNSLRIPASSEVNATEQRTQHESEQVEQSEDHSVAASADNDAIGDNSDEASHSASDAPLSSEYDSARSVKADAREKNSRRPTDDGGSLDQLQDKETPLETAHEVQCHSDDGDPLAQHRDSNTALENDPSLSLPGVTKSSLRAEENHEELHKTAGSNHGTVDAATDADNSTEISKHEQSAVKTLSPHRPVGTSSDLVMPSDSSPVPELATARYDRSTGYSSGRQQPADSSRNLEQNDVEASRPPTSLNPSEDKHTDDPQRGTEMSAMVGSVSSTTPSLATPAADKVVGHNSSDERTAKRKELCYERSSADSDSCAL